jgi:hypothetical protein
VVWRHAWLVAVFEPILLSRTPFVPVGTGSKMLQIIYAGREIPQIMKNVHALARSPSGFPVSRSFDKLGVSPKTLCMQSRSVCREL